MIVRKIECEMWIEWQQQCGELEYIVWTKHRSGRIVNWCTHARTSSISDWIENCSVKSIELFIHFVWSIFGTQHERIEAYFEFLNSISFVFSVGLRNVHLLEIDWWCSHCEDDPIKSSIKIFERKNENQIQNDWHTSWYVRLVCGKRLLTTLSNCEKENILMEFVWQRWDDEIVFVR